jgi:hypothetical protein
MAGLESEQLPPAVESVPSWARPTYGVGVKLGLRWSGPGVAMADVMAIGEGGATWGATGLPMGSWFAPGIRNSAHLFPGVAWSAAIVEVQPTAPVLAEPRGMVGAPCNAHVWRMARSQAHITPLLPGHVQMPGRGLLSFDGAESTESAVAGLRRARRKDTQRALEVFSSSCAL